MLTLAHKLKFAGSSWNGVPALISTIESSAALNDYALDAAFDASQNLIVVGYNVSAGAVNSGFLMKISPAGTVAWQRKLSMTLKFNAAKVKVATSSGNIYIGGQGRTSGAVDLPHIAKYNSSGTLQWQRSLSKAGGTVNLNGLCIDSSENVYLAMTDTSVAANAQIVAKYNTSGAIQWQRAITHATNSLTGLGVAVDSSSNVYLTGTHINGANNKITLIKYNSAGAIQLQKNASNGASDGGAIAIDGSNNIYLACGITPSASQKPALLKFDTSLNLSAASYTSVAGKFTDISIDSNSLPICTQATGPFIRFTTAGLIDIQRSLLGTVSGVGAPAIVKCDANYLYLAGAATRTSTGSDGVVAFAQNVGGGMGVYDWLTYAETSATVTTGTGGIFINTTTFTDAAGALNDSAGTFTDAAGSLVTTSISRTS